MSVQLTKLQSAARRSSATWGIARFPGLIIFHHLQGQDDSYRAFPWSGWVVDLDEGEEMPWDINTNSRAYQIATQLIGQSFARRSDLIQAISLADEIASHQEDANIL